MKTAVYVEKAVEQWRNMFACGDDTTADDENPANPIKKEQATNASKPNSKFKDSSNWLRQMTNKFTAYGNIERIDTDSTSGSQSEEDLPPVPVVETIRLLPTVPTAIATEDPRPSDSDTPNLTTKHKKTRPRGPKKRLGRNREREKFYQTPVVYDLGYDAADEEESDQDIPITTANAQQDKTEKDDSNHQRKDYGPSTTKKRASQSIDSYDAFSISVLTMKEFDEEGNFAADVIRKGQDYTSEKMTQMMKGINIKSSIARIRHYKQKQAEQQERREQHEIRREQEELLQKRLQQRRREKERKEQEEQLQKQLDLQKKRDEEKQKQQPSVTFCDQVDKWEDEFMPSDGNTDDSIINNSVSDMSSYLAPPSRVTLPPMEEENEEGEDYHLRLISSLRLVLETPTYEEDAPSDEEDEPEPASTEETSGSEKDDEWETFEGGHVFHKGSGKKHPSGWKTGGFKWVERPWRLDA